MGALFVTGTGTDVGKTWVAAALARALLDRGRSVEALKPVVSGFDPERPEGSDPAVLLAALGRPVDPVSLARVSPFQFRAPLAPPQAAAREGRRLDLADLVALCRDRVAANTADWLLIEGAGGVMSPLAERATGLDLMAALGLPSILVAGTYLGSISHSLTALECLSTRGLAPLMVVVSARGDPADPPVEETRAAIEAFSGVATLVVWGERGAGLAQAIARLEGSPPGSARRQATAAPATSSSVPAAKASSAIAPSSSAARTGLDR